MTFCVNIPNWSNIRKTIVERDKYRCRICLNEDDLHVHHIDYCRLNNQETNLVTLCQSCHHNVHTEKYKPHEHDDYPAPWDKTAILDEYNQDYI